MEACAENYVEFIVLDRPNPNGFYIDGPMLDPEFKSFVGMLPIPVVHGMTVGELAKAINQERWMETEDKVNLKVITCKGYERKDVYVLPVKPSPNLPNQNAILLYPSLCFFEGTVIFGITITVLYPLALFTSVKPIPVLPKVPSTQIPLGSMSLFFSASSIIPSAVRSLMEPPGLRNSAFP